jgi:hypothetical protein
MIFTLDRAQQYPTCSITVGTFSKKDDLIRELASDPCNISSLSVNAIQRSEFVLESERAVINMVGLTFPDMGFPYGAYYGDMMNWGAATRLEPSPHEAGPQRRLQYLDQSAGEWHRFAMKPIKDEDDRPVIWRVGHENEGINRKKGLWLCTAHGHPDHNWRMGLNPKYRFWWKLPS